MPWVTDRIRFRFIPRAGLATGERRQHLDHRTVGELHRLGGPAPDLGTIDQEGRPLEHGHEA